MPHITNNTGQNRISCFYYSRLYGECLEVEFGPGRVESIAQGDAFGQDLFGDVIFIFFNSRVSLFIASKLHMNFVGYVKSARLADILYPIDQFTRDAFTSQIFRDRDVESHSETTFIGNMAATFAASCFMILP